MSRRGDASVPIPPVGPPMTCSRCGRIYEQTVQLADGKLLRGHVPGGPGCTPTAPVRDKRERRKALVGR